MRLRSKSFCAKSTESICALMRALLIDPLYTTLDCSTMRDLQPSSDLVRPLFQRSFSDPWTTWEAPIIVAIFPLRWLVSEGRFLSTLIDHLSTWMGAYAFW